MANDIKIGVQLDNSSIRIAEGAFNKLVSVVDKLNTSMDKLSKTMARMQTGGAPGTSAIKTATSQQKKNGVVGAVLGDSGAMGQIATETEQLFDRVGRKSKKFVDDSLADLQKLAVAAKKVNSDAGWSGKATASISSSTFAESQGIPNIFSRFSNISEGVASGSKGDIESKVLAKNEEKEKKEKEKEKKGGLSSFVNDSASLIQGFQGGSIGSILGGIANMKYLGPVSVGAGLVYGAYKGADALSQIGASVYDENVRFKLENPIAKIQAQATASAPFKSITQSALTGDFVSLMAWKNVWKNPEVMANARDTRLNMETVSATMKDKTVSGQFKEGLEYLKTYVSTTGLGVGFAASTLFSDKKVVDKFKDLALSPREVDNLRSVWEIQEKELKQQVAAKMGDKFTTAYNAERQKLDPLIEMQVGEFQTNYLNRHNAMAMAGRSTKHVKRNGIEYYAYEDLEARAIETGHQVSDYGSNYQQMLNYGAGFKRLGGTTLVDLGMGGFTNAGQLVRSAATAVGSADFGQKMLFGVAQKTVGGKGIDIAVGRDLYGNFLQAAATSQAYSPETLEWLTQNVAGQVYGGGRDVGYQQQQMQRFEMGNQLNQSYFTGTRSPLNFAMSQESAMMAAGGYNRTAIDLIRLGHDPKQLAAVAAGAQRPDWLDESVTADVAKDFLKRQRQNKWGDVVSSLSTTPESKTSVLVNEILAAGGDPNVVIRSRLENAGLKKGSKGWFKGLDAITNMLGGAIPSDNPSDIIAASASLRQDYLFEENVGAPKGSGVGKPAMTAEEKEIAKKRAEEKRYQGKVRKEVGEGLKTDLVDTSIEGRDAFKGVVGASVEFGSHVESFKRAVGNFAQIIERMGRAKAP
jgi:hypothetical protein